MKFRKKPVVIEAIRFDGSIISVNEIIGWAHAGLLPENNSIIYVAGQHRKDFSLHIRTLEGTMLACPGDWIIKGVNGEFYPCKPDIFEKTYERVSE